MRIAIVDAGSNSFILLIAQKNNEKIDYVLDLSTIVGMGKLKRGEDESVFEKAISTIKRYHQIMSKYQVKKRVIVGTEVFRKIPLTYFQKISEGFDEARILSGEEEAILSYRSVVEDETIKVSSPLVMDIGGGSVEYSFKKEEKIISNSIPMGAIVLTNEFVGRYPIGNQLEMAKRIVREQIKFLPKLPIVSIGGTGTTIGCLLKGKEFSPSLIHGMYVKYDEVRALYEKICALDLNELSKLPGMEKGREKILAAGILIFMMSMETSKNEGAYISIRGHRYALAKELLESEI